MQASPKTDYPNIVPDLVFPFERPYFQGRSRFPALVFAQRGAIVLFAVEYTRQFGVGMLDPAGIVSEPNHFPTLDKAAQAFLSLVPWSA
jgi:hypothetical protein